MARNILRILILALFPFLYSCASKESATVGENPETNPGPTAEVAHGVVSATIDGAVWESGSSIKKDMSDAVATIDPTTGVVTIRGTRSASSAVSGADDPPSAEKLEITLKSLQPGTYPLSPDFNNLQTATYSIGADTSRIYYIHEKQSGEATIAQSDTASHHLSGTFFFDARNSQGKDIHVTNGRFDVLIKR